MSKSKEILEPEQNSANFVATKSKNAKLQSLKVGDFFYTEYSTRLHHCKKIQGPCSCVDDFDDPSDKNRDYKNHYHIEAIYVMDGMHSYFNDYKEIEIEPGVFVLQHINQIKQDRIVRIVKPIQVSIKYLAGAKYMVIWNNCPHKDNVLISGIPSIEKALISVKKYGFQIIEQASSSQKASIKSHLGGIKSHNSVKTSHQIECDFCGNLNYPSHDNPYLFWGFRDGDTGMFIGHNCKQNYYKAKNAGKYGAEHANKISEIPEPVPQDPYTLNSELSNQGLERLLPSAPSKKRGLSSLLSNKIVATKNETYSFDYLLSRYTHSEPVDVNMNWKRKEIVINWRKPSNRKNVIIPISARNNEYIRMQLSNMGFSRSDILDKDEEDDQVDSLDKPVTFIGQFGYNENGALVIGAINATVVSIDNGKIYGNAEVGQTLKGWSFGINYGSKFTHVGSGGGSHGAFIDSRYQYHTEMDATIAALYHLKRGFEGELKKAPEIAAKSFRKAIDQLKNQIAGAPEPSGFDILAEAEAPTEPEKIQKQPVPKKKEKKVDPFAPKGGPRTEMTKFRCSKVFKELLSEMAKIKDCSVADLIHEAIQKLPRLDYKLIAIEQERLNEII